MATFIFNNQSQGTSYAVLEVNPDSSGAIPASEPKYLSGSSITNLVNLSREDIVFNNYQLGIVIPEGNSSVDIAPGLTLPLSESKIRGAGECFVDIVEGATTINLTPNDLNSSGVDLPEIQGGGTPPSPFTNPFCFEFNGNSDSVYVSGNNTALNLTSSMSISTWVTIDEDVFNTGSGQKDYYIVDKLRFPSIPNNTVKGYGLYIRRAQTNAPTTVKLRGLFGVNGKTIFQCTTQVDIQAGAANALAPNTPHNIVITYNENAPNKNMRMYINGALVDEKNNAGTFDPASTQNFIIGNASFSSGAGPGIREYHGKIDEVSIWDTELTEDDVTSLYDWDTNGNLNNYSKSSNLQGWYRMGENATFTSGKWKLRSATDPGDPNLELTGEGVAQTDRKEPGLVGPA